MTELVSHLFIRAQEFDLRGALSDSGDRRLEESHSPKSTPSEFWRNEFALPPNISQPMLAQYSAHLLCHLSDPRRNQVLIEKSGLSDYWLASEARDQQKVLNDCRSFMWRGWTHSQRTWAWKPSSRRRATWKRWPGRSESTGNKTRQKSLIFASRLSLRAEITLLIDNQI